MRVEHIGDATLYLGRMEGVLPTLARPAAIISDPPYGQAHKNNIEERGGKALVRLALTGDPDAYAAVLRGRRGTYRGGIPHIWPDAIEGDDAPFDPAPLLSAADRVLLWGAHRFADRLPPGTWLVWDKVPTGKIRDQGDGEAAWVNDDPPRPLRIHRLLWDGICVGSAARQEVTAGQSRVHPTQKPVPLMQWCIEQARVPKGGVILDPYAGSGSTLVAALRMGHPCIGIECEPVYFETMCRRVAEAQMQADMFVPRAPAPKQEALL